MSCFSLNAADLEILIGQLVLMAFFGPIAALCVFFWVIEPAYEFVRRSLGKVGP